jgi:dihydroxyacid dehydratase/phosphogluconate dehydratase
LAGGPIGKLREGDLISIEVDPIRLTGRVDFVGTQDKRISPEEGGKVLSQRSSWPGLSSDARLPDDTRLWAALQSVGGGTWAGCVYDVEKIIKVIEIGMKYAQPERD